jgi:hypothetical protein
LLKRGADRSGIRLGDDEHPASMGTISPDRQVNPRPAPSQFQAGAIPAPLWLARLWLYRHGSAPPSAAPRMPPSAAL